MQEILLENLTCNNHNIARLLCTSKKCNQKAFVCAKQSCISCYQSHQYCRTFWTKTFLQLLLKKKKQIDEQAMKTMKMAEESYEQLIEKLKVDLSSIRNRMKYYGMTELQANLTYKLHTRNYDQIKGQQLNSVLQTLLAPSQSFLTVDAYNKFKKHKFAEINQILAQYKNAINAITPVLNSKIITDIQQISQFFDIPLISARLLYRASQNNYSSHLFHEQCDDKINTLTILRTEDGNILGAFTPVPWTKDYCYYYDQSSLSFIFTLSKNRKLKLTSKSRYAIYCSPDCGPTFGDNNDLLIGNDSNVNQSCYFYPGSCYEYPQNSNFQEQQQLLNSIMGSKRNGNNFRADQWQVYQLQFLYNHSIKVNEEFIRETLKWEGGGGGGGG